MSREQTSAIIVAGGGSTRLGRDKRELRLWGDAGPTLLENTVGLAAQVCAEVIVVLNDPERWGHLPARLVGDAYPGAGPLGGLASGLAHAAHPYALALACDMPWLDQGALAAMVAWPRPYDALAPQLEGGPRNRLRAEPLHAIYRAALLPRAHELLASGERAMHALLRGSGTILVLPQQLGLADGSRAFRSINTPEDLGIGE